MKTAVLLLIPTLLAPAFAGGPDASEIFIAALKARLEWQDQLKKDLNAGKLCQKPDMDCVQKAVFSNPIKFSVDLSGLPSIALDYGSRLKSKDTCTASCKKDIQERLLSALLEFSARTKPENFFARTSLPAGDPSSRGVQMTEELTSFTAIRTLNTKMCSVQAIQKVPTLVSQCKELDVRRIFKGATLAQVPESSTEVKNLIKKLASGPAEEKQILQQVHEFKLATDAATAASGSRR